MIENQIAVGAPVQVSLRVRFAEMERTVTRAIGVNWTALGNIGRTAALGAGAAGKVVGSFASTNALSPFAINPTAVLGAGGTDFNAVLDALAQDNLVHILAEPNLTALSGEPASFLAGGQFPVPVAQQNNTITVDFKSYGVTLAFVPTVLAEGRISLHVSPEVSELTTQGAVQLSEGNAAIQIPALTVRRAETTVELGSGQSFMIAGLLSDQGEQAVNAVPALGDVPVLGALFRSSAFQKDETELVILVTPYIVRPVDDAAALGVPTDSYHPAGELDRIFQLRQLARQDPALPQHLPGQAGFIVQ